MPERLTLTSTLVIVRIVSKNAAGHREGGRGREECEGLNYEREFMQSARLFRARETLLPQGSVTRTFFGLEEIA